MVVRGYNMTFEELQKQYDELNDFSNSQCKKLLEENERLKKLVSKMKNCCNCKKVKACNQTMIQACIGFKYLQWEGDFD